jgi:hypothetical protein
MLQEDAANSGDYFRKSARGRGRSRHGAHKAKEQDVSALEAFGRADAIAQRGGTPHQASGSQQVSSRKLQEW